MNRPDKIFNEIEEYFASYLDIVPEPSETPLNIGMDSLDIQDFSVWMENKFSNFDHKLTFKEFAKTSFWDIACLLCRCNSNQI